MQWWLVVGGQYRVEAALMRLAVKGVYFGVGPTMASRGENWAVRGDEQRGCCWVMKRVDRYRMFGIQKCIGRHFIMNLSYIVVPTTIFTRALRLLQCSVPISRGPGHGEIRVRETSQ